MQVTSLQNFMLSLPPHERRTFAEKCGTTHGQIKQIYTGNRNCNPGLAIEIEKHSQGAVNCESLCPDVDFNYLRKSCAKRGG